MGAITDRILDFNPHSRKGSDLFLQYLLGIAKISIHTPATGVTIALVKECSCGQEISIHTPAKGVTAHYHHRDSCK